MGRSKRNNNKRSWLFSKWFLIVGGILLILLSISLTKELYRSYKINKEISDLNQEISSLEKANDEYSQLIEYLKTDRYFEEQARLKLGLKSPGEQVIVVKGDESSIDNGLVGDDSESNLGLLANGESNLSNPEKWLTYFFGS